MINKPAVNHHFKKIFHPEVNPDAFKVLQLFTPVNNQLFTGYLSFSSAQWSNMLGFLSSRGQHTHLQKTPNWTVFLPSAAAEPSDPTERDFQRNEAEGETGEGGEAAAGWHGGQNDWDPNSEATSAEGQRGAAETGAESQRAEGEVCHISCSSNVHTWIYCWCVKPHCLTTSHNKLSVKQHYFHTDFCLNAQKM